jgi:hypothetical protein
MHLSRGASFLTFPAVRLLAFLSVAIGALTTPDARASDEKQVCVRAVEHAQLVRLDGKLREARSGFVTCARAVCPDAIREDCTRWVAEVDASLPTVVVDAVWADGRDVAGLTVMLDGQPLPDAATGRAVAVDPGTHAFRFEVPGALPIETRNVVREGEKNRILHITFAPIAPAGLAAAPVPAAAPAPAPISSAAPIPAAIWHLEVPNQRTPSAPRRPIPTSALVVGGFALAGFGGFAYAGLSGTGQLNYLRSTCAPSCNPATVTSARQEILIGDVLGYFALAAAGVATWLVVTRPVVPDDDPAR